VATFALLYPCLDGASASSTVNLPARAGRNPTEDKTSSPTVIARYSYFKTLRQPAVIGDCGFGSQCTCWK